MLEPFAERLTKLVPAWMQRLRHLYVRHQPSVEENTLAGARQNIERHYDLSNDLFALFLDDSMTYSSAWFMHGDTLELAQARKIDRLLDAVGVALGTRVLEIGTGWGSLAIRAARRGARVTTLTLSREQQALARQRAAAAGVGDRVDVQLRDYRDAEGQYDAVVSVEMIEAVGERYWPTYFAALDRLVTPHGRVGLQAIVLDHARMVATRHQYTWISKYIFPGGALPSMRAIDDCVRQNTNLRITERFHFGGHYARTLHCWKERFDAHADGVDAIGFDYAFRRMWDLYLAYCEAGFATGYLDVAQLVLEPRH
jgi:cyclopropane-fatty-acyl-phospholipid synthase